MSLATQQSDQRSHGRMALSARYHDIDITEDDDFYFLGHIDGRPPFWATPKPAYFDGYEHACQPDDVATLQHVTSQNSCTPAMLHHGLTLALAAGSVDCARELLLRGAPIAQRAPENVLSAPEHKQVPLLDALAAQGWTPSHDLFMRIITDTELLRWVLSRGANPSYGVKMDTPFKAGGPSYENADALEAASAAGSAEGIEMLIAAGAKIADGTPLHFAAGARPPGQDAYEAGVTQPEEFDISRIPAMASVVAHGAAVNQKADTPHMTRGYSLVHAVSAGAVRRARWLLEHGADAGLKGGYGCAADYAAAMGSAEMKGLFHSHGHVQSG